ncbi:hypothetical protein OBBRIDRAFT_392815 [Obba rivulosa]|uniref:Uncharacterized protein n=1 Tax=Obba rivulosa TaxID=1052685 RepID=A0A8E2B2M8_9APHY|nr:hypothetical protein OBBRIDRAFT_392815 [Obba rivulosa]
MQTRTLRNQTTSSYLFASVGPCLRRRHGRPAKQSNAIHRFAWEPTRPLLSLRIPGYISRPP